MSDRREAAGPPGHDPRSLPRRVASAVRANLRRGLKRAAKLPGLTSYRLRRGWLVSRKWTLEGFKETRIALKHGLKLGRKRIRLIRRWFRRTWRLVWRMLTLKKTDRFGRTRTLKRAQDQNVRSLDDKPFEIEKLDRRREIRALRLTVSRMARSRKPVVVGPWLSEIGFELLYWVPFVHWAKAYGDLRDRDLWVVSRGGVRPWYDKVSSNYIEIFDDFTPDEFREQNLARQREQGGIKHRAVSRFDEEILEHVRRRIGEPFELFHPSLMYEFFQPFFQKVASFRLVEAFSFYGTHPTADLKPVDGLPDDYVAVKFYANDALPATPENRRFLSELLGGLSRHGHVVSLDTGTRYDDHDALAGGVPERLHSIDGLTRPQDNLAIQSRIIANARTLYCTYGGFSYIAPLSGTRAVSFYSDRSGFRLEHLELARRVFSGLRRPPFLALDVADLPYLLDPAFLDRKPA